MFLAKTEKRLTDCGGVGAAGEGQPGFSCRAVGRVNGGRGDPELTDNTGFAGQKADVNLSHYSLSPVSRLSTISLLPLRQAVCFCASE